MILSNQANFSDIYRVNMSLLVPKIEIMSICPRSTLIYF